MGVSNMLSNAEVNKEKLNNLSKSSGVQDWAAYKQKVL